MHMEITQAADFLGRLLHSKLDQSMLQAFKEQLADLLKQRFVDHWDPQQPYRGNAFRAISNFNGQLDPVLVMAAEKAMIPPASIHAHLPRDFVLWIDPFSVSYRVGDHGNIMTLFEDRSRGRITLKPLAASYIQPRTSTPIRISPPNSPENRKVKNHIHQSSPLAKNVSSEQEQQQQQTQQQQQHQQQQLVLAN
ncbi:BTG-domain-containing protein [Lichtheimia hyalospora FSU 10163]|nr:BTG-domain-containing protein [Lichtheimia hyalospora FSU 10163]